MLKYPDSEVISFYHVLFLQESIDEVMNNWKSLGSTSTNLALNLFFCTMMLILFYFCRSQVMKLRMSLSLSLVSCALLLI